MEKRFDKNRSIRVDSLFFNEDGTIQKVTPTLRGVGPTSALAKIEIDRYSLISNKDASIAFLDTLNTYKGWKTILNNTDAWIQYNAVDFGTRKLKSVQILAYSSKGSTLQIRLNRPEGILLGEVKIPEGMTFKTVNARISEYQKGVHNLVIVHSDNNPVQIDWIQFIK